MKDLTRRDALRLASIGAATAALRPASLGATVDSTRVAGRRSGGSVPVWEIFELALKASCPGNPFTDARLSATFALGHRTVTVNGFYDGGDTYKLRFMPDTAGTWTYKVRSNLAGLDGIAGGFEAVPPLAGAHGPAGVCDTFHFAYADGTPFFPFGTTCYAWIHQSEALQQETLKTLRNAAFNKVRMCVFPKSYEYNTSEPPFYPFERSASGVNDFTRFNPAFFRHLEERIADLGAIGVQADLILFHPYDRWGFAAMPPDADDRYVHYLVARLSAYRNVWWSMANEYDLMHAKTAQDFDRLFHILEQEDAVGHLRSIHYSKTMYDYARPWITHASLQSTNFAAAPDYLAAWNKPVCYDEVQYEGNLNRRWGNLSGEEMTRRFWLGVINGCYVTHGETYLPADQPLDESSSSPIFWSQGGPLRGSSPVRIAFLRKLLEETANGGNGGARAARIGLTPQHNPYYLNAVAFEADGNTARAILYYFDDHQPIWYEFPLPEGEFTAEWIDPLAMKIEPQSGRFFGKTKLRLPGRPYQAVRFRAV